MSSHDRKGPRHSTNNDLSPDTEGTQSRVVFEGRSYDLAALRSRMDTDLVTNIGSMETDQEFFDAYLIAHADKYGEGFRVH